MGDVGVGGADAEARAGTPAKEYQHDALSMAYTLGEVTRLTAIHAFPPRWAGKPAQVPPNGLKVIEHLCPWHRRPYVRLPEHQPQAILVTEVSKATYARTFADCFRIKSFVVRRDRISFAKYDVSVCFTPGREFLQSCRQPEVFALFFWPVMRFCNTSQSSTLCLPRIQLRLKYVNGSPMLTRSINHLWHCVLFPLSEIPFGVEDCRS